MALAAETSDSGTSEAQEWSGLSQRQELILSQLDGLQTRLDKLTSNSKAKAKAELSDKPNGIMTNNTHSHSTHHKSRMSTKDLAKLDKTQNEMLDRLLNVTQNIDVLSKSKDIPLDVDTALAPIVHMIDRRLSKVISKAQFLIGIAKQSTERTAELTPDSVRSQGTPVFRPRKLSSAGLEPMQILPFHNEPKESETEEYLRRINELEYSVNHFRDMVKARAQRQEAKQVTPKDVYNVLANMNLGLDLQQVMHARHISILTKLMTDSNNSDSKVDIEKLCHVILDINKTDRGDHKHEWHHFRRTLIGMERKEGCLRIHYRFDGWPYPQTVRLFHRVSTKHNEVFANDIGDLIHDATREHIDFAEIAYAEKSKHGTGKTSWVHIDLNDGIPLHVEKDGWLEVDVWLKTKEFIVAKRGKPFPKYA